MRAPAEHLQGAGDPGQVLAAQLHLQATITMSLSVFVTCTVVISLMLLWPLKMTSNAVRLFSVSVTQLVMNQHQS